MPWDAIHFALSTAVWNKHSQLDPCLLVILSGTDSLCRVVLQGDLALWEVTKRALDNNPVSDETWVGGQSRGARREYVRPRIPDDLGRRGL